jgi:ribokinase
MVKIVVLASFNMDLVMRAERRPNAGETLQGHFAMHLGGKGFNHAVAARRLGAEVAVLGRVGDDEFGRLFLAALDREGIERQAVMIDRDAGTGVASIIVEPDGTNTIVQSPRANRNVSPGDIERARPYLSGGNVAMAQLETSMPAAEAFVRHARDAGMRTLLNPAPAADVPNDLARLSSIVIANEIEAATMANMPVVSSEDARRAARALAAGGATVIVTLGASGAIAVDGDTVIHEPAVAVAATDTTGAGDAFCAAFAVRTAEGASLGEAVRFANAAGAVACTRAGAEPSMPVRIDVDAMLLKGAVG